MQNGRISILPC